MLFVGWFVGDEVGIVGCGVGFVVFDFLYWCFVWWWKCILG